MYRTAITRIIQVLVLIAVVVLALKPAAATVPDNNNGPELPMGCESLAVEEGNKLVFHVYAKGTQVYRWNGLSWDFVAPVATLYAEANYFGEVGSHYVGPHWESKSGSKVKADRIPGKGCSPDPNAVPWIILQSRENSGHGIFKNVTFIQRTNTTGGMAPVETGLTPGELKEVPYTAEYYFYRGESPNEN